MEGISKEKHDELCTAYASMILFDGQAEITSEAISTIIASSNNEVEPYWPMLFANVLSKEGKVLELISSGGGSVGGAAAANVEAGADGEAAPADAKKEEEEEEDAVGYLNTVCVICNIFVGPWRRNGYVWR